MTLVGLWDSLEAMRASEDNLFLTQAISRFLACCEGFPHITEQELLASDFIATSARAQASVPLFHLAILGHYLGQPRCWTAVVQHCLCTSAMFLE